MDLFSISDAELMKFFFSIALLLAAAHGFGYVFQKLRMPRVVGEIFGGLLLGPTVLGVFAPTVYQAIASEGKLLAVIYWLGLVLLMFISGFEVQSKFDAQDRKTVIALVIGSTIIPFIFGWWITSFFDVQMLMGPANNLLSLKLIVSVAMAITSIPVISRMFIDMGIMDTRFAKIVLGAATMHDVLLWIFVTVATSLVTAATLSAKNIAVHVLVTLVFFGIVLVLAPRFIRFIAERKWNMIPQKYEMAFIVLMLILFVTAASYFSINIVFGAFLAGVVVGYLKSQKFEYAKTSIKDFSLAFFVPIYFAIVGVKLDLLRHFDPVFSLLFMAFATLVQVAAVVSTAKILRYGWLGSFNLALAMNSRGGPGIVLGTLAFDLGIISETFFVTLVLNAIVTSLLGGAWLRYVLSRGWPLLDDEQARTEVIIN
ncbi:MAG TPA: cation:proton antiporter [Candidatus Nanoarchaeia archaeon]|nr:cation:proton antiporter [Candidatus Nanoarchaeia archaeon]